MAKHTDNTAEVHAQRLDALAIALVQFHPELMTAVLSDEARIKIAKAIDDLIAHHCLRVTMALAKIEGK